MPHLDQLSYLLDLLQSRQALSLQVSSVNTDHDNVFHFVAVAVTFPLAICFHVMNSGRFLFSVSYCSHAATCAIINLILITFRLSERD